MSYLKTGSFNINDLKVTLDLRINTNPGKHILVVQIPYSLSQRLGSGETYIILIAFEKDMTSAVTCYNKFIPCPVSYCQCANGYRFCTHIGALLLLLYLIEKQNELNFNDMKSFLPTPIITVAQTPIPLTFTFPPPGSVLSKVELVNHWVLLK